MEKHSLEGVAKSLLCSHHMAHPQQRLAKVHHGAKAHRSNIEQARESRNGAGRILGAEPPHAQPVQGFAGHGLQALRLRQLMPSGFGVGKFLWLQDVLHARQVKPSQPIARILRQAVGKTLGQGVGIGWRHTAEPGVCGKRVLPWAQFKGLQLRQR